MATYATLAEANAFFANRVHKSAWDASDEPTKTVALNEASLMLGRLNYSGTKTDPEQELEFPRGADETEVPEDIKNACCEIAYAILDGVDIEAELANVGIVSQGYASVRSTHDAALPRDHIAAGIPSASAWRWLQSYLRDPRSFKIVRVS